MTDHQTNSRGNDMADVVAKFGAEEDGAWVAENVATSTHDS